MDSIKLSKISRFIFNIYNLNNLIIKKINQFINILVSYN